MCSKGGGGVEGIGAQEDYSNGGAGASRKVLKICGFRTLNLLEVVSACIVRYC
jgi:hypothetical protein